jgi:hypothetical protein
MEIVVVGSTFHGDIAPPQVDKTPVRAKPFVRYDLEAKPGVLAVARKLSYPAMAPTVLEAGSHLSTQSGTRLYYLDGRKHKSLRLTFVTGAGDYWGVQETDWADAPILGKPSATQTLRDGRTYDFYYNGSHLHMIVLRGTKGAGYWVVNTLLDSLSNETMIAIAKGLKPVRK